MYNIYNLAQVIHYITCAGLSAYIPVNVSDAHRMDNWVDVCLLYEVDHRVELNF